MDDYVSKPVNSDALLEALSRWSGGARSEVGTHAQDTQAGPTAGGEPAAA
jgi:hypothetical protein